jgi:uncharacterized protein
MIVMRSSKYNVFFEYQGKHIGFNCYSREYVIIEPLLLELYSNGAQKNDFSELKDIHINFYNFLVDKGFLVDDSIDEFEQVKEMSRRIDSNSSNYELIINPTMNCNFKCWYCYETHIKDSKMDIETVAATIAFAKGIITTQEGLKNFRISFFGGEPLLYFKKVIEPILISVSALCKENDINFICGMTTNGLLIDQQMLDVCSNYGLQGFQITLDGNREQHDKVRFISEGKGSYDRIVSNIILAAKNKRRVTVRVNISPNTLINIDDIQREFINLNEEDRAYINFDFHKVWQVEEKIDDEIDNSRLDFKENGFKIDSGFHDTVVNSCYADKRYQATINYNGEVFKCTARDFKNGSGEGKLNSDGSIDWNERYEKRLNSKFNNPPCKECSILPICGGGCSQQALEHEGIDYCVHDFDESSKVKEVIKNFLTAVA